MNEVYARRNKAKGKGRRKANVTHDRVPALLQAMSPLPCPIDLFVLTNDEMARAQQDTDPLVREALTSGIELL